MTTPNDTPPLPPRPRTYRDTAPLPLADLPPASPLAMRCPAGGHDAVWHWSRTHEDGTLYDRIDCDTCEEGTPE